MSRIITMNDFLTNPTGKSSASFTRRDLVIANLGYRYNELVKKTPITHTLYKCDDYYLFYVRVPSEKYQDRLIYDVIVQFMITDKNSERKSITINDLPMKMYSNSPNFMFTYAYVYNQDDNLVNFLTNKLNSKALTDEPKVKNPQFSYGFEKSVYFALLHIKKSQLNFRNRANMSATIYPKLRIESLVNKSVKSSQYILDKISDIQDEERTKKRIERENKKKEVYKKRTTKKLKDTSTNKISSTKTSSFKTKKARKSLNTNKKKK